MIAGEGSQKRRGASYKGHVPLLLKVSDDTVVFVADAYPLDEIVELTAAAVCLTDQEPLDTLLDDEELKPFS